MPFVLGIEITNRSPLSAGGDRNRFKKWMRDRQKQTLLEVAAFWHRTILPRHFNAGADAEYQYEPRSKFHLTINKQNKGKGKGRRPGVLNLLSGQAARWMMALPRIRSASAKQVFLAMRPPRYFTNPFVGTITTKSGKRKQVTRQPDKPGEITTVSERDSERMRKFGRRALGRSVRTLPPPERIKI